MIKNFMKIRDLIEQKVPGEYGSNPINGETNYPVLRVSNLTQKGTVDISDLELRHINEKKAQKCFLKDGDILIAKSGNPKCVLYDLGDKNYIACNFILALRPNKKLVNPSFFFLSIYWLFNNGTIDDCYNQVTIQNLNIDSFLDKKILVPSLEEQNTISEDLTHIRKTIALYEKQSLLLDDYLESLFVNLFGDPIENSKHFTITHISDIGELKNGMNFKYDDAGFDINCLGVGDFKDKSIIDDSSQLPIISINEKPSDEYMLKDGDIVFVRSNGNKELVGRSVMIKVNDIPTTFSGFCIRFRNRSKKLLNNYLLYYFKNYKVRQEMAGRGANIQNLNQQILNALSIPIPYMDFQKQFSIAVDKANETKKRIFLIQKELNSLLHDRMATLLGE